MRYGIGVGAAALTLIGATAGAQDHVVTGGGGPRSRAQESVRPVSLIGALP